MKKPTCDDVVDLIDLYAAGECDPAQEKAVRAHVGACGDCRQALEESRRLMGLLDVHYRQQDALSRLGARLEAEARPARRVERRLRIIHRFAAVAAMLLVTFGLGVLLFPVGTAARPIALQLSMVELHAKPDRDVPMPPVMQEKSKAARDDREFARGKKLDRPLPPRIDLELKVTNPGRTAVELDVGGPEFRCELELRGGRVERRAIDEPAYVPFPRRALKIPAGGSETLKIERLASQAAGRVQYLYPTPGEYAVRVRLEVAARRGGLHETLRLTAGPRTLRLP